MELKQALAQLIDAYADAKATKNSILTTYATQELQRFLMTHDLVSTAGGEAPSLGGVEDAE